MGMFAYVEHSAPCHKCGAVIDRWQTKDPDKLMLQTVKPEDIPYGAFYALCPKCSAWNQYRVLPPVGMQIVPEHDR